MGSAGTEAFDSEVDTGAGVLNRWCWIRPKRPMGRLGGVDSTLVESDGSALVGLESSCRGRQGEDLGCSTTPLHLLH